MANIFDVEPPRWLQEIAKPIDAKATGQFMGLLLAGAQNGAAADDKGQEVGFLEGYQQARQNLADPNWKLKQEQAQAATLSSIARSATAIGGLQLAQEEQRAWLQDLPVIQDFASKPVEEQIEQPLGAMRSKRGNQIAGQMNRGASSGVLGRSMTASKSQFDTRVAKLVQKYPDLGTGLALPPGKFPSVEHWRALEQKEEQAGLRTEMNADAAVIDAQDKGMRESVTVDSNGKVTRKFQADVDYTPQELDLGDGNKFLYNPHTGSFKALKKGGETKDMTLPQMQQLAKAFKNSADPRLKAQADYLYKFLMGKGVSQAQEGTPTPTAAPAAKSAAKPAPAAPPTNPAPATVTGGVDEGQRLFKEYEDWKKRPAAIPR